MSLLEIKGLKKSYQKGQFVLKGIDLSVEAGDIFAFIGHNGAGKTTTIKCVAGILNYEEGEIIIGGNNVKTKPLACKKELAYVPDNPDVYGFMTGLEFLEFILSVYDISGRNEEIQRLAADYELTNALGMKISEYSHGMKQKLVIISAIIRHPKLMILDEPFVGLDPLAAKKTKDFMREFCDKGGAIFFSTHVLETAERLCNKVAIIKDGEIVENGLMEDVLNGRTLEDIFITENTKQGGTDNE